MAGKILLNKFSLLYKHDWQNPVILGFVRQKQENDKLEASLMITTSSCLKKLRVGV